MDAARLATLVLTSSPFLIHPRWKGFALALPARGGFPDEENELYGRAGCILAAAGCGWRYGVAFRLLDRMKSVAGPPAVAVISMPTITTRPASEAVSCTGPRWQPIKATPHMKQVNVIRNEVARAIATGHVHARAVLASSGVLVSLFITTRRTARNPVAELRGRALVPASARHQEGV